MATLACTISSTGITAPDYADILAELQNAFYSIYGTDSDLDADSQDGQWLAILAQAIYDANQVAVAVYNAYSPTYAQGVELSSIVKINGLARQVASASTDILTITGQATTAITGGQVGDNLGLGTVWDLPSSVIIPSGGTINVTITCETLGAIQFEPGQITNILTPTLGWQSATNIGPAVPGAPVETDAALRQRQAASTALPAQTIIDSIYAAVAAISGVSELVVYENDTDTTDGNGLPPHSIAVVVLGGNTTTIAETIALEKSPGTTTYGSTSVIVFDQQGVPNTINFDELVQVPIAIAVTVTPLAGFSSIIATEIQTAIFNFISGLKIGEDSYLARLYSPANLGGIGDGATFVVTAITQAIKPAGLTAADITIAFNQQATIQLSDIAVTS